MIKERLISALIGTLLILSFQPFGFAYFGWMRWLLILGLTVCITASCLLSEYIIRYVFRMPNNPSANMSYTVRRNIYYQIVNILLMTTFTVLYLDRFVNNEMVDNHLSMMNTLIAFSMFCGASLVIGLYWRNVYWKRHYMHELADAQRLNGMLEERQRIKKEGAVPPPPAITPEPQSSIEATVLLEGSTKESLSITPSNFLYAESDGNYVSVYYIDSNETKKSVLRTSIKNVAQALCTTKSIMQCHRAFIANISFVERVESRSSGIGLKLKGTRDIVPVSKTYVQAVKQLILDPQ